MAGEYERLDSAISDIDNAETDREAIKVALTAVGQILLDILEEIRDGKDA